MKLYEIDLGIRTILEMIEIDEETGEILGDIDTLDQLQYEAEQQMECVGCYIKELEAECADFAEAIANMKKRMDAKKKKAENLKRYLSKFTQGYFASTGAKKFETPNVKLTFRASSALELDDKDLAFFEAKDLGLIKVKVEESIDATAVKDYIKAGNTLAYAKIVERQNIQIK